MRDYSINTEELSYLVSIAKQAGALFAAAAPAHEDICSKEGRGNFVTEYDKNVQEFIYDALRWRFPQCSFCGEEDAEHEAASAGLCFIVDPIDGTANFINSYKHSAVSIACARDGQVLYGVVYDPYLEEIFYASRGQGAFLNGVPLHIPNRPLADSTVLFGTASYDRGFTDRTFRILRRLFDRALDLRSSGSAALDICYVAAGKADVFFELQLSPWDYAAAGLILEEAGGVIRSCDGSPVSLAEPGSVVASGTDAYPEIQTLLV